MQRPDIKKVRALYAQIESSVKSGKYLHQSRSFEYCQPSITERTIYTDSNGTPRLYILSGGSDDHAEDSKYYYDSVGTIRFIFVSVGAVNGANEEKRIYFDERGKQIYTDKRVIHEPDLYLERVETVLKPMDNFKSDSPCPEKK